MATNRIVATPVFPPDNAPATLATRMVIAVIASTMPALRSLRRELQHQKINLKGTAMAPTTR
jgi:hypothetical protein